MDKLTETFSVRFPTELVERLDTIADRRDRSRAYVIRECCEKYLPVLEKEAKGPAKKSVVG